MKGRSGRPLTLSVSAVACLLIGTLAFGSSTPDPKVNIRGKPKISVVLQDTTATITASWSYAGRVDPDWQMLDEWRSSRVSGGDAWDLTGASPDRTATIVVPRSNSSDALGEFCVVAVRVSPQPARANNEKCATFVVPMEVLPPVEVDSVTINVAGAPLMRVGLDSTTSVPVNSLPNQNVALYFSEQVRFTGLMWRDGVVIGCTQGGDCDGYPQASYRLPWGDLQDLRLAMAAGVAIHADPEWRF